jgi:hypothetical protein
MEKPSVSIMTPYDGCTGARTTKYNQRDRWESKATVAGELVIQSRRSYEGSIQLRLHLEGY